MNPITNPRSAFPFLALLLLGFCATAQGEEAAGVYFQHGDWEVVCDNNDKTYAYWVTDSTLKNSPRLVTTMAVLDSGVAAYSTRIEIRRRERDEGDCWSGSEQIWDGQAFRLRETWTTGMCSIRIGGAWHLPTFVTRVVREGETPWNFSLPEPRQ
jgi:hypothetical protein